VNGEKQQQGDQVRAPETEALSELLQHEPAVRDFLDDADEQPWPLTI